MTRMNITEDSILVLNGGSSSIKFAFFTCIPSLPRTLKGQIERIGTPAAVFSTQEGAQRAQTEQAVEAPDYSSAVKLLIDWMEKNKINDALIAVGHRIVHGGPHFHEPQKLTSTLLTQLRQLTPLDRQHMPGEIGPCEADAPWTLGYHAGGELHLRPSKSRHQEI